MFTDSLESSRISTVRGDLRTSSALELAALVRTRQVSAEELAWSAFDAIDRLNPLYSAFVDVMRDLALRDAAAIDRKVRSRAKLPPFAGVPIGVKNLNLARGSFTRFGSRAFSRLFSPFDDATVARLRAAGFVIVGKTATSEAGALPVTEPDIHPPTRNPFDLGVTSGGSSGGAGAAVACGMLPIAQGSDAGGSIRIPSSFCNLFGLKPSRGRLENSYGLDDDAILYSAGPMTRTVDDAAAMLDAMAGITVGKPHWAPVPPAPFLDMARKLPRALKVRVVTENPFVETELEIVAATKKIARYLESLGYEVEEGAALLGNMDEFIPIWQNLVAEVPIHDWQVTQPLTRWLGENGRRVDVEANARTVARLSREVLAWFGDADLIVTPTVAVRPPRIGAWNGLEPEAMFREAAKLGAFTAPFNLSGQPAASIPAGMSSEGLPIGVQIVGRPLADATVLAVCKQIESAMPWRHVRAPEVEG